MSTQIYMIRHGQSEGNKMDAFLGHTDLDLTEQGHAQAELAARFLSTLGAQRIYASDLLRAYHTACHTAKMLGLPIIKSEKLREIYAGEWEGRLFADLIREYPEDYGVWRFDIGKAACTGGESVRALGERVMEELLRIARENDGKTVLIFTHATPIRTVCAHLRGVGLEGMRDVPWPSNTSSTHIEYENGTLRLIEYSRDDYLGDISTALPRNV